jgi:hypothetical protein
MTDHDGYDETDSPRVIGGVDTHKDVHVAAVLDEHGRLLDTAAFPNSALWTIVMVRIRSNHAPTIAYMQRRTADGLTKREAIRCLKRYVARETYNDIRTIITQTTNTQKAA